MTTQRIVTERAGTLGLLTYQISRETFGRQTDQIVRAAENQKYQVVISLAAHRTPLAPMDDQARQIKQLLSRDIVGLLIHMRGDKGESERIVNTVQERVPVVTFHYPTPNLSGVVLDNAADFFEVTEHLIRLGHERIGFIGPDWDEASPVSAKAKGYLLAMQKHGLPHELIPALGIYAKGGICRVKGSAIGLRLLCAGMIIRPWAFVVDWRSWVLASPKMWLWWVAAISMWRRM